jgi:hypothetical protein
LTSNPTLNMTSPTLYAMEGALRRPQVKPRPAPRAIVAGATGVLGGEVLRRLAGGGQFAQVDVMAREPIATALACVGMLVVQGDDFDSWAPLSPPAQVGVVMFEPPRLYYDRERALWTPVPGQLPALARWLRRSGVQTLVVVMPHASGRLPDALKRGLANLDEHAVAAMGFERMLLVRSAQKAVAVKHASFLKRTAAWMLSILGYMIPATEQPLRPSKLAEFVEAALRVLPPGTHVASPELLWRASQAQPKGGGMQGVVKAWLNGSTA